jgi:hypothetical protein
MSLMPGKARFTSFPKKVGVNDISPVGVLWGGSGGALRKRFAEVDVAES